MTLPWQDGPLPQHDANPVKLRWARLNQPLYVVLLDAPRKLLRHRVHGKAVLCHRPRCPWCDCGLDPDPRWYAPALVQTPSDYGPQANPWARAVWELTEGQMQVWPLRLADLVICRTDRIGHPAGCVRVVKAGVWKWGDAPERHPVDPIIERVFGAHKPEGTRKEVGR
jgi:hypothetical protein